MVDVFISYPRRERARADLIKTKLTALGLDLFFDIEGIDGGAEFPAIITHALDNSKAVLACCSPLYFTREWCLHEAHEGADGRKLVPVIMERFHRAAPPVNLRRINFLDLSDWSGQEVHENWTRTISSIAKLTGKSLSSKKAPLQLVGKKRATPVYATTFDARPEFIADLRATWTSFVNRQDQAAVEKFLDRVRLVAPGSGVEFEVENWLNELREAHAAQKAKIAADKMARNQVRREATVRQSFPHGRGKSVSVEVRTSRFRQNPNESG